MTDIFSLKIEGEEIVFADLTERENLEIVIVCKSGNVYLFDCRANVHKFLMELHFSAFALNLRLYSCRNYVCIVQQNGLDGIVFELANPNFSKKLERGKYHADVCSFPIAFYLNENQTFLIHGTDWNRLDITCLETDELLTNRIVDYETSTNYFDYFHSSLVVSPDSKHFTSNGWVWQPYDIITAYSIERFLKEFEMSHVSIDFERVDGYNWDRPLCWTNNQTLGIGYNKKEADEGTGDFPSEIIFVNVLENKIINRIEFDGFAFSEYGAVVGDLFFDAEKNQFIGLNKQRGLLISDGNGKELRRDVSLTSHDYSPGHKVFYRTNCQKQTLEIIKLDEL